MERLPQSFSSSLRISEEGSVTDPHGGLLGPGPRPGRGRGRSKIHTRFQPSSLLRPGLAPAPPSTPSPQPLPLMQQQDNKDEVKVDLINPVSEPPPPPPMQKLQEKKVEDKWIDVVSSEVLEFVQLQEPPPPPPKDEIVVPAPKRHQLEQGQGEVVGVGEQGQGRAEPPPPPQRVGAIPKIKIPPGAGATAIAALTGKPHRIPEPYERPVHPKDKPQSWETAKQQKKMLAFYCFRCHRRFDSHRAWDQHQNVNPHLECPKYKEDIVEVKHDFFNRPAEVAKHAPCFEDNIEELDPEDICSQIRHLKKTLPSFSDLGRPPFTDIEEYLRRHEEFMSKEKADARGRGEKVRYSWSKVKKVEEIVTESAGDEMQSS